MVKTRGFARRVDKKSRTTFVAVLSLSEGIKKTATSAVDKQKGKAYIRCYATAKIIEVGL